MVILEFSQGSMPASPMNDGVMGGVSSSRLRLTDSGSAVFEGQVSLENGGGFASVGIPCGPSDLSPYHSIEVHVFGDGQTYQIRLRGVDDGTGIAYRARFRTQLNEWETIGIPLDSFEPTRRGRRPEYASPLPVVDVRQIGFLIGDRQEGPFRLEVAWVRASGHSDGAGRNHISR